MCTRLNDQDVVLHSSSLFDDGIILPHETREVKQLACIYMYT